MPDTARPGEFRKRIESWLDAVNTQKSDNSLQNALGSQGTGVDEQIGMAARVLQSLQLGPPPGFIPANVWTARLLGWQICVQKDEPVRWADALPHIRHFAMLLDHRSGIIAELTQTGYKG